MRTVSALCDLSRNVETHYISQLLRIQLQDIRNSMINKQTTTKKVLLFFIIVILKSLIKICMAQKFFSMGIFLGLSFVQKIFLGFPSSPRGIF